MHDTLTAAAFHQAATPMRDAATVAAAQAGMPLERADLTTELDLVAPSVKQVLPGYCPTQGCRITHFVEPVEIWTGHRQWRGSCQGEGVIFETWMVA